ncbi:zinc-dependent alcohol dehydrogenase [Arthrobacter sp. KNU-44]|uniref:zinc-dependent alcohol dehydrogenase n=1 Tax=Arthrobacter sp. KNU-44 TaxID=3450744 RepID=UPI003F41FEDA
MNSSATTFTKTARAAVYMAPGKMQLTEFELPPVGPDDLLVEVSICGVDGSELKMFRGDHDWLNERTPVIFGDEIVGRVAVIGEEASNRRGLSAGDRVVVESRWPCADCHPCAAGQYYLCETRGLTNGYGTLSAAEPPHLWGGYSTHVFVPGAALVYKVPDSLSDRTALIACSPVANGIRWVQAGNPSPGSHIAIIGPGPQGLSCAMAAVAGGMKVTLLGLEADRERLELARSFGAEVQVTGTDSSRESLDAVVREITDRTGPVDVVVETSGSAAGKQMAMALVRTLGTIVSVAAGNPGTQPFDWRELMWREITVVGQLSHPHTVEQGFTLARSLLAQGIDLGNWVTHEFSLDDTAEAIRTAAYQTPARPIKVVLNPNL